MKLCLPVRLALREEGNMVNAYLAKSDSMVNAILIGSIAKGIVENDRRLWLDWKAIMTSAMANAVKELTGAEPDAEPEMIEESAPEHERAGHG
jgi:hypothetical protein